MLIVLFTLFILFIIYWTFLENGNTSWLLAGKLFKSSHKYIGGAERAFIIFYLIASAIVYRRIEDPVPLSSNEISNS